MRIGSRTRAQSGRMTAETPRLPARESERATRGGSGRTVSGFPPTPAPKSTGVTRFPASSVTGLPSVSYGAPRFIDWVGGSLWAPTSRTTERGTLGSSSSRFYQPWKFESNPSVDTGAALAVGSDTQDLNARFYPEAGPGLKIAAPTDAPTNGDSSFPTWIVLAAAAVGLFVFLRR